MTFDEVLIGQLLKIPSSGIDITLCVEELGFSYLEINKTISHNRKSTFIPNKINQLTKIPRIIAYILAANVIQKKGHFDELSSMTCKAVYAIIKNIPVNWVRVIIYHMTHIKTKLFYGPLLTYIFIHFGVPLENEPNLPIRAHPIDDVAIVRMEKALERAKALKSARPSSSSSQVPQDESSEEEEEENKEELVKLRKEIEEMKLQSNVWQSSVDDWQMRKEKKMDDQHSEMMRYLHGHLPPPSSQ